MGTHLEKRSLLPLAMESVGRAKWRYQQYAPIEQTTPIKNNSTIAEKILALPDKICYNIYVKIRKDIFTKWTGYK